MSPSRPRRVDRRTGRLQPEEGYRRRLRRCDIPVTVSTGVASALWTKLVVNCAYNAIPSDPLYYGVFVREPAVTDVMQSRRGMYWPSRKQPAIPLPPDLWQPGDRHSLGDAQSICFDGAGSRAQAPDRDRSSERLCRAARRRARRRDTRQPDPACAGQAAERQMDSGAAPGHLSRRGEVGPQVRA